MENSSCECLQVGQTVPDFKMETYEPTQFGFGEVSLEQLKKDGKWTLLVFYPADFTFVCSTELSDLADEYENLRMKGLKLSRSVLIRHLCIWLGSVRKSFFRMPNIPWPLTLLVKFQDCLEYMMKIQALPCAGLLLSARKGPWFPQK